MARRQWLSSTYQTRKYLLELLKFMGYKVKLSGGKLSVKAPSERISSGIIVIPKSKKVVSQLSPSKLDNLLLIPLGEYVNLSQRELRHLLSYLAFRHQLKRYIRHGRRIS